MKGKGGGDLFEFSKMHFLQGLKDSWLGEGPGRPFEFSKMHFLRVLKLLQLREGGGPFWILKNAFSRVQILKARKGGLFEF